MNIRLSTTLHEKLQYASDFYNLSMTEIGNRAMRKWNNQTSVAIPERKKVATTLAMDNPINLRFHSHLVDDKSHSDLRYILDWYIDLHSFDNGLPLEIDPNEKQAFENATKRQSLAIAQWQFDLQTQAIGG